MSSLTARDVVLLSLIVVGLVLIALGVILAAYNYALTGEETFDGMVGFLAIITGALTSISAAVVRRTGR